MNLLARRLEIPLVVWKMEALSLHEKILLAVIYALDRSGGAGLTYHDIGASLHRTPSHAASLLQAQTDKGYVVVVRKKRGRFWLQVDTKLTRSIERENTKPRLNLTMYFIQCLCEYNLRMDYAEQIRVCPQCLRAVYLTLSDQKYVRRIWKRK